MRRIHYPVFLLLLVLLAGCGSRRQAPVRAMYYWKTVYRPGAYELNTLHNLGCRRMYLRCFDADWNAQQQTILPVSIIRLPAQLDTSLDYVPVFFLTQQALDHLLPGNTDSLAANISRLLARLCADAHINPRELQADCDWTGSKKDNYFALLKALKQQAFFRGRMLSCTIRMHQVKYITRSGIPPADKGLLMCYNMGDLKKYGDHNSILDPEVAAQYLAHVKTYPLRLDVALPLFHWCLLFRGERFAGILRDVQPESISADTCFEQVKNNLYRCKKDMFRYDYGFHAGDIVRAETYTYREVIQLAGFLVRNLENKPENICLFHCDSLTISRYAPQQLEKIYAAFD